MNDGIEIIVLLTQFPSCCISGETIQVHLLQQDNDTTGKVEIIVTIIKIVILFINVVLFIHALTDYDPTKIERYFAKSKPINTHLS